MQPPPESESPGPAGPDPQTPGRDDGPGALRRMLATAGKVAAAVAPYAIAFGIAAAAARWTARRPRGRRRPPPPRDEPEVIKPAEVIEIRDAKPPGPDDD